MQKCYILNTYKQRIELENAFPAENVVSAVVQGKVENMF